MRNALTMTGPARPRWARPAGLAAIAFGLATLASGGSVLFGPGEAREAAGHVVPFVLWFNFASGFLYVAAGIGLYRWKIWGARLATFLALAISAVGIAFAAHVLAGGSYETRTLAAMLLRAGLWIAIAVAACRALACLRLRPLTEQSER